LEVLLSLRSQNLSIELFRESSFTSFHAKVLSSKVLNTQALIVVDSPHYLHLFHQCPVKLLFSLEYSVARRLPFLFSIYSIFFNRVYEWETRYCFRSRSILPFFPSRVGISYLNGSISQVSSIDHFSNSNFLVYKKRLLSSVMSGKSFLPLHRSRLELIRFLKHRSLELDLFGRDSSPVSDKSEALIPYYYHIACENSTAGPSEKLWDPILCECVVFYSGSLHLVHPFLRKAIIAIPTDDPQTAALLIQNELHTRKCLSSLNQSYWNKAKKVVIDTYSFEHILQRVFDFDLE